METTNKKKELIQDIENYARKSFDKDYSSEILEFIGDDVLDDVMLSSGYEDEDIWNDTDIKFSFGRVLSEKLRNADSIIHYCYDLLDNYKEGTSENSIARYILSILK